MSRIALQENLGKKARKAIHKIVYYVANVENQ